MTVATDFHWSELQRSPTSVEKALAKHRRVRLLRRGKPPVVLTTDDDGLRDAAPVFAAIAGDQAVRTQLISRATTTWPWLTLFNDGDRATFADELTSTLSACASLGEFTPLTRLLTRWRNTASAIAAGVDLTTPIRGNGIGDVARPGKRRGRTR